MPFFSNMNGRTICARFGNRLILKGISVLLVFLASFPPALFGQNPGSDFETVSAAAAAARDQGDVPRAIELYRQAVTLNAGWPDGWWYLGTLEYGTNAYAAAIDDLSHYIALTPKAGPAFALRGLCEFEMGALPQSLEDLQRGIALGAANQPRNASIILYHEAILLTRLGRFEEALGKFSAMVKQGNAGDDVTNGIGLAVLRMPVLPADIDTTQQPLVSSAGAAAAEVMKGDLTAAAQSFAAIFARFPATPNLHYSYGYLLSVTDPEGAIAQFRKELEITPSSAIPNAMLAWTLGAQGDYAAALPYARKAAEEDPSMTMGQLVLGRDLVETGDIQDGLPHLEGVVKQEPNNLDAHLALAKAYSELGRKDDAQRERLLCLALTSHNGQQAEANATL